MGVRKRTWTLALLFCSALFLAACGDGSGGSGPPATGTVSLALTDSSTNAYRAVYVTIDEVQAHTSNAQSPTESGWRTIAAPMKTYNLLRLVNGVTETLGEDELAVGNYQQIRLIIGNRPESENNLLGTPHPHANYIILNDGLDTIEPMKIPSGFNTGIKLVHSFEVEEGRVVELLLDFDACRSVVETGSGKYILKPTIKVIQTEDKSEVSGRVTVDETGEPVTGAMVSAQISEGGSASVVRSTLTSDEEGQEGRYSMLLSPGQTYSIVAYSDEKAGAEADPKMYAPACEQITVPLDHHLDFVLQESNFRTIYGSVSVEAEMAAAEEDRPVVTIGFFAELGCGYVQVTSLSLSPDEDGSIAYSIDLPVDEYDVVASSEGFVPATTTVNVETEEASVTADTLTLEAQSVP